jgi:hypothetical protein
MSCANLDDVYTLDYLVRTFKHRARDVVEHRTNGKDAPHDFAYAFFWSLLAYKKHLLRSIFDKSECSYELHLDTARRTTPFAYTFRNLRMKGDTKTSDTLVIGIRGTNKFHDVVGTLARIEKRQNVPDALRALQLPDDMWERLMEELTRVYETMHAGIYNHSLMALAMIAPVIATTPKNAKVFVHGHSLGASCAAFVSYFLGFLGFTHVSCTCLSGPPVFDSNCPIAHMNVPYLHYYTDGDRVVTTKWISGNRWKTQLKYLATLQKPPALKAVLPKGPVGRTNIKLQLPETMHPNDLIRHTHYKVPCGRVSSLCSPKQKGFIVFIEHVFMNSFVDNVKLCRTAETMEKKWDNLDVL